MNIGFLKKTRREKYFKPFWLDAQGQSILLMYNDVIGDDKHSR
jgi:hypothetical protein